MRLKLKLLARKTQNLVKQQNFVKYIMLCHVKLQMAKTNNPFGINRYNIQCLKTDRRGYKQITRVEILNFVWKYCFKLSWTSCKKNGFNQD